MPAGIPPQGLFRFACVSIALVAVIVPGVALLGLWSPWNDYALQDTYYTAAQTQQVAMGAALAVPNQVGAIICAMLAVRRSGALAAGWVLAGSALVLFVGQILPLLTTSLAVRPQRYVEYAGVFSHFAPSPLTPIPQRRGINL